MSEAPTILSPSSSSPSLADDIFRILKKFHPSCGVSAIAMNVICSMTVDLIHRLVLSLLEECPTGMYISHEQLQTVMSAVVKRMICVTDDDLAFAVICDQYGQKIILSSSSYAGQDDILSPTDEVISGATMSTDDHGTQTSSSGSGLLSFSIIYQEITRILQTNEREKKRIVTVGEVCYISGVVEYIVELLLDGAGKVAIASGVTRITPRHFHLAIDNNPSLRSLMRATIAGGGTIPSIAPSLVS